MLKKISFLSFVFIHVYLGYGQDTIKKEFWDNGSIKKVKLRVKDGKDSVLFFYENKKLRFTGIEYKENKIGFWNYYRISGKPLKTDYYLNGLQDSLSYHYGLNNKIEEIRTYNKDTLNGFLFKFYPSGQLMILEYNVKGESIFSETYFEKLNRLCAVKNQLPQNVFFVRNLYPDGKIKKIYFKIHDRTHTISFNEMGILIGKPILESE